jgi:Ca2+-binding EF-hand superfamily protein
MFDQYLTTVVTGTIDFNEFVGMMTARMSEKAQKLPVRLAFRRLDDNGNGTRERERGREGERERERARESESV